MRGDFRAPWWTPAVLLGVAVGPALVFESAFGGGAGLIACLGGALVGLAVAWASGRWRWDALTTAVVATACYLGLGGAAATPETSIGGVVPTLRSVQVLLFGVVHAWRDLLTVALPAAGSTGPAVLPWLLGLVAGLASGLVTWRAGRPLLGTLPWGVLALVAVAFGPSGYGPPAWPSALWVGGVLAWLAWSVHQTRIGAGRDVIVGARAERSASEPPSPATGAVARPTARRVLAALATLLLAGGMAVALVDGRLHERTVLRDLVEPPLNLHDYASPLASYRHYTTDLAEDPMLTLSSLPAGARVRLGVMDAWDGIAFTGSDPVVSGHGRYVPTAGRVRPSTPDAETVTIEASGLVGPWLPSVGAPQDVAFTGANASRLTAGLHANTWADALLTTTAPRVWGTSYTLTTTVPPVWADGQLAGVPTLAQRAPEGEPVPQEVAELAQRIAAAEITPLGRARAIERHLAKEGFYSSADTPQSRPGHRADRLIRMLQYEELIGDDEQYAALMALMLQSQGIPARVVMGFYPEQPAPQGESVVLRGRDAHVWVEIPFEGLGWAVFDPTPPRDQVPQTDVPEPRSVPRPQVLQPPDPPEPPVELPPHVTARDVDDRPDPTEPLPWGLILGVGGGALALLGPVLGILAAKALRRRRRRGGEPTASVLGAWAEAIDLARDAGVRVPTHLTRSEAARHLTATFLAPATAARPDPRTPAASGPAVEELARRADTAAFSPEPISPDDAQAAWGDLGSVRSAYAAGASRWARWRSAVSVRSLWAHRTPPVRRGWWRRAR